MRLILVVLTVPLVRLCRGVLSGVGVWPAGCGCGGLLAAGRGFVSLGRGGRVLGSWVLRGPGLGGPGLSSRGRGGPVLGPGGRSVRGRGSCRLRVGRLPG